MPKFLTIVCFLLSLSLCMNAQYDYYGENSSEDKKKEIKDVSPMPAMFVGVSNGINNMSGIIGVHLSAVVINPVIVEVSGGIGLWGFKTAVDAQVYLPKKYPYGPYFKTGYSRSSGTPYYLLEDSISGGGTQTVELQLKKVDNLFFTVGWALKVPRKHKFHFEIGYALNLTPDYYRIITPNVVLSEQSEFTLNLMKPSGIIIGLGFSFGI